MATEHLEMILETISTGKNRLDVAQTTKNCLAVFQSHGLSETEFKAHMLLDGAVCPFHVTSHDQALPTRRRGYSK
ncbi:hypothetical protein VMCG_03494 [Cytospora schulzeri]|uniref:Uncharacterized protein n=1 Tax=Cytospora schulzeri TaxID=448051 RepID=A0A423WW39_9PEZI|nr:hypothetical protein VMCG_03494 [Valsa malicola]